MSKESFARGFCKVAEAHGVDPQALAKFAQTPPIKGPLETPGPTVRNAEHKAMLDKVDKDTGYMEPMDPRFVPGLLPPLAREQVMKTVNPSFSFNRTKQNAIPEEPAIMYMPPKKWMDAKLKRDLANARKAMLRKAILSPLAYTILPK